MIVAERAAGAIGSRQHDGEKTDGLAQSLKRRATASQAAIRPREQDTNPRFRCERREPRQAAKGEKSMEARIPKIEKLEELRAITRAWIEIQRSGNRSRNA